MSKTNEAARWSEADQSLKGYGEGVRLYVGGLVVEKNVLSLWELLAADNVIILDKKATWKNLISGRCDEICWSSN